MTNNIPNLLDHVRTQLASLALDRKETTLLLAISGGADSTALLHAVQSLNEVNQRNLHVIHINHLIRKDAHKDADHVSKICHEYNIPCTCITRDIPATAAKSGKSLEMEARKQRYEAFAKIYHEIKADALLTAHHRDDQVETILLNLSRGCSPASMAGIPADSTRQGMRIIRPMLEVSREQILEYLQSHNLTWREDETNLDIAHRRNAIRHNILPAMREQLNPQIDTALLRTATMAQEDECYMQERVRQEAPNIIPQKATDALQLKPYQNLPAPLRKRILVHWLQQQKTIPFHAINYELVQRIDQLAMEHHAGKQITIAGEVSVQNAYDRLVILNTDSLYQKTPFHRDLTIPGVTDIPELQCQVEVAHATGFTKEPVTSPGRLPASCHIRLPQNEERLWIRTRREGDQIQMTGSPGHQKLQDIFTDEKVPSYDRDQIPLLVSKDELVWIPGLRIAQDWAVSSEDAPSLKVHITPHH